MAMIAATRFRSTGLESRYLERRTYTLRERARGRLFLLRFDGVAVSPRRPLFRFLVRIFAVLNLGLAPVACGIDGFGPSFFLGGADVSTEHFYENKG